MSDRRRPLHWGYLLRTGVSEHDLDGYIFDNWEHAAMWMSNAFVKASGYSVHAALYRTTRCCGAVTSVRVGAQVLP